MWEYCVLRNKSINMLSQEEVSDKALASVRRGRADREPHHKGSQPCIRGNVTSRKGVCRTLRTATQTLSRVVLVLSVPS